MPFKAPEEESKGMGKPKRTLRTIFGAAPSSEDDVTSDELDTTMSREDQALNFTLAAQAVDADGGIVLEASVQKRSRVGTGKWSKWESRHVEVLGGLCMYFKTESDSKPKGSFKLADLLIVRPLKPSARGAPLEIGLRGGKSYQFVFSNTSSRNEWFRVLGAVTVKNTEPTSTAAASRST